MECRITGLERLYPFFREMKKIDITQKGEYRINLFELIVEGEEGEESVDFSAIQPIDLVKRVWVNKNGFSGGSLPADVLVCGEITPGLLNLFNVKVIICDYLIIIEKDWKSRIIYL